MEHLLVTCDGDKASAKFKQDYTLTNFKIKKTGNSACDVCNMKRIPIIAYSSKADKELQFERINNNWQIVRELTIK
jgi:adhesin transport system outer membrane protein